ncbi:MAG: DUF4159 domain-containing protein [Bacteroidetes bacterium]|nr:DUF4159 domain-containing protein [Bacteroidota bacterium]
MRRWMAGLIALLLMGSAVQPTAAQDEHSFRIAAVKYDGGGDWYQASTPLPMFLRFVRENTLLDVAPQADEVELTSAKLFNYPFLVLSGHGNVVFSDDEAQRLRRYLNGGGFLYVDDDYGLDPYIRREMQKVFPEQEFVELPFSHPIYQAHYAFPNGLPKIHEHDGEPPQGYGLFDQDGRLAVFYTVETNLTDGWEPESVHDNPPEKRRAALRMGTNILVYAMTAPVASDPAQ